MPKSFPCQPTMVPTRHVPMFFFRREEVSINQVISRNIFFQLLYLESGFSFVANIIVANLARLGILVHCQVSVRSQYLVRFLSQCWITGGHTIHPPIEGLLPQLVLNPHCSEIRPPKQLDYRCMSLQQTNKGPHGGKHVFFFTLVLLTLQF